MKFIVDGQHGYGPYSRGLCRCEVCREAKRQRQQEIRARRAFTALTHGKKSTYDCGCRCEDCRQAKAVADKADYDKHLLERRAASARRARERYWRKKAA